MLDPTVFPFGVLADKDGVDIVIRGFVAGDRHAGADVGKEIECTAKSKIERDMAFSYRGLPWNQYVILRGKSQRFIQLEVL